MPQAAPPQLNSITAMQTETKLTHLRVIVAPQGEMSVAGDMPSPIAGR